MFIIWGSRNRKELKGYCAEFCPACREVRAVAVSEVREVFHVYFIPLGRGRLAATEVVCTVCGSPLKGRCTPRLRGCPDDLAALLADVPAKFRDEWSERLAEEDRARRDPASLAPAQRVQRIEQILGDLEPLAAKELTAETKVDWTMVGALLLWCAIVFALVLFGERIADWPLVRRLIDWTGLDGVGLGAIVVAGSAVLILLWLGLTHASRVLRRQVLPKAVPHLHPLNPTLQELAEAKRALRKARRKVARFRAGQLARAIAEYRP